MALPYDNAANPWGPVSPFSTIDPVIDAEIGQPQGYQPDDLTVPDVNPTELPSAESIIDPAADELDAQMAAEQSALGEDWTSLDAEQERFDAAAIEPELDPDAISGADYGIDPALEAEMLGLPPEPDAISGAAPLSVESSDFGPVAKPEYGLTDDLLAPDGSRIDDDTGIDSEFEEPTPDDLSDEGVAYKLLEARQADEREKLRLEREAFEEREERNAATEAALVKHKEKADQRSEDIFSKSKELAEKGINKDRWVEELSFGQKVAAAFAVIASGQLGLISGRGGNESMDFFLGEINKDIAEQRYNLEQGQASLKEQGGLVKKLYQEYGDMAKAEKIATLSTYEAAMASMDNRIATADPNGTTALKYEADKRQLKARIDGAKAAAIEEERKQGRLNAKDEIEARDADVMILKHEAEVRKLDAATGKLGAEARKLNRRGTGPKKVKEPSLFEKIKAEQNEYIWNGSTYVKDPNAKAPEGETAEQAELRRKIADANASERALSVDVLGASGIVDKQGNPIKFQDASVAKDISVSMGATITGLELIDEMLNAIDKHGWSSDTVRSPEWQEAQANMASLALIYKDTEKLGALAEADLDLVAKASGMGDDITGIRDPSAGLRRARKNLARKMNNVIQGYRPNAANYKFAERRIPKDELKSAEEALASAGQGLPDHIAALDPSDPSRVKNVANQRVKMESLAAKSKGSYGMMSEVKSLKEKVDSGDITLEEAIDIASPLSMNIAKRDAEQLGKKHKAEILKMSVKELKESKAPWLVEMRKLESIANKASQAGPFRKKGWEYMMSKGK